MFRKARHAKARRREEKKRAAGSAALLSNQEDGLVALEAIALFGWCCGAGAAAVCGIPFRAGQGRDRIELLLGQGCVDRWQLLRSPGIERLDDVAQLVTQSIRALDLGLRRTAFVEIH